MSHARVSYNYVCRYSGFREVTVTKTETETPFFNLCKSDQHEISPYNVNALENRLVMRIEFMTRDDEESFRSEFTANL